MPRINTAREGRDGGATTVDYVCRFVKVLRHAAQSSRLTLGVTGNSRRTSDDYDVTRRGRSSGDPGTFFHTARRSRAAVRQACFSHRQSGTTFSDKPSVSFDFLPVPGK